MGAYPAQGFVGKNSVTGAATALTVGPLGDLRTTTGGSSTLLNITTPTVVKAVSGRIGRVSVVVAGSAAGGIYDAATTGSVAAANQISAIPNTIGLVSYEWLCTTGIVVVPGTGQTVSVSFT